MRRPAQLNLSQPGLFHAIRNPRVMALWERLRRHRRAATAVELAALCGYSSAEVQSCLDLLQRAALVRRRRASQERRTPMYDTSLQAISVLVDLGDSEHARLVRSLERYMTQELEVEHFKHETSIVGAGKGTWRYHHCSPLSLDEADLLELKARIARVEEFIRLLNDKQSADARTSNCNHAVAIRVAPLRGDVMPQPHVELVSREIHAARRAASVTPGAKLSRREREALLALRDGKTRAAVAQHLGISVLTLGTICKRAYRKLGINRVSQLRDISLE